MNTAQSVIFLGAVLAVAAALEFGVARSRSDGGDSGAFWARLAQHWAFITVALAGLSIARDFSVGISNYLPSSGLQWAYILATLWVVLFLTGLAWPPTFERGRWLAGGIGFTNQRLWILGFVAALAIPLVHSFGAREVDESAFWISTVLMAATLVMTGLSAPLRESVAAHATSRRLNTRVATNPNMTDWPEAMAAAGVRLDPLPPIAASLFSSEPVVPAEMMSAIERLAATVPADPESKRTSMIFAPPFCGQEEALASILSMISRRLDEVTLIITPRDPGPVVSSLRRWTADATEITIVDSRDDEWTSASVWIAEANVLSDYLLGHLRDDSAQIEREQLPLLNRVGLIVWWDVHEYSGVRAANLWAISRRLDRLITAKGRLGLRTLIFAASPAETADRASAFLGHLLPYQVPKEAQVHIQAQPARTVQAYLARGTVTQTVEASIRSGWSTWVHTSDRGLELSLDDKLAASLTPSLTQADASVIVAGPDQIASLPELLVTCGRSAHADIPHYVALLAPRNPYIDFLLARYKEQQRLPARRLLVGAEGHPALIARHAQLALREHPDTRAGLRAIFRWDDEILSHTLRTLDDSNQLHREAVRFLDSERRLHRDSLYSNQQPGDRVFRTLDTVSEKPVEVRYAPSKDEEPRLWVDPKREIIDAYPRRVFFHRGRRYRVLEGTSRPIMCNTEDVDVTTWRGRTSRFQRLSRDSAAMASRGVKRYAVTGEYREELTEVIEQSYDGIKRLNLERPLKTEFPTRGLVLETAGSADPDALSMVALALRCIVPVHVGVQESHLEVVPLVSERLLSGGFISGIAFVDLMPGGIGVTEAFQEDEPLLHFLIDQAYEWLASCRGKATPQEIFRDVPTAIATGGVAGLRLESAVDLLAQMAGRTHRK